jgi:hypothetical protein
MTFGHISHPFHPFVFPFSARSALSYITHSEFKRVDFNLDLNEAILLLKALEDQLVPVAINLQATSISWEGGRNLLIWFTRWISG